MVGNGGEARVEATGEPESSVQLGGVTIALKGAVNLSLTSFLPGLVLPPGSSLLSAKRSHFLSL